MNKLYELIYELIIWTNYELIFDQLSATDSIFNKVADFETAVFQHVTCWQLFLENLAIHTTA